MTVRRIELCCESLKAAVLLQVYPTYKGMRGARTRRRHTLESQGTKFAGPAPMSGEVTATVLLYHGERLGVSDYAVGEAFTCVHRVGRRYATDMLHEIVHIADFLVGTLFARGLVHVPARASRRAAKSVRGEYRAYIVAGTYGEFLEWQRAGYRVDKMGAPRYVVFPDRWRKKK